MLRSDPNFRPSQTLEDSGGGDNSSPANLHNRNFYRACIRSVGRSPCLFKRERGWWSRGRFKFLSSLIFILGSWWFFPLLEGFFEGVIQRWRNRCDHHYLNLSIRRSLKENRFINAFFFRSVRALNHPLSNELISRIILKIFVQLSRE